MRKIVRPSGLWLSLLLPIVGDQPAFALTAPAEGAVRPGGPATLVLSWSDQSDDETGFEIEVDDGNGWLPLITVPADATHAYHRGLTPETSLAYRVRAIHAATNSEWLSLGSTNTTPRMNIVFILADDMGYKDIVALRNPEIDGPTIFETPRLDALSAEAVIFRNAYCSGPRCVVARRSMLTGKYDWRPEAVPSNDWYLDHNGDPVGGGLFAGGISVNPETLGQAIPDNVTFGEAVKSAGYRTCYIGKYHLGDPSDQPPRGPAAQGFDVSIAAGEFGAPVPNPGNGLAYFPDPNTLLYEGLPNLGPAASAEEYLTDRLTEEAIGFIGDTVANHAATPFFVTLAHYAVHTPAEAKTNDIAYFTAKKASMAAELAAHPMAATPLIRDTSSAVRMIQDNRVYAAMMKSYDDSLGAIRDYLAATDDPRNPGRKLSETTVLVVSSDHGGKSTLSYGGGTDPAGPLENDAVDPVNPTNGAFNTYSRYPTSNYPYRQGKTWVYEGGLKIPLLVFYPGVTEPGTATDALVHGADLFATLADIAGAAQQPGEATDSISCMLSAGRPARAARRNSFHFFTNASSGTGNPAIAAYREGDYKLLYFMVQRRVELYNLAGDLYERNDLSASRPDLAAEMLDAIYRQHQSTGASMPKPGSSTWNNEQAVLVDNGVVSALPAVPDAAPSGLNLVQLSPTTVELTWTVNAANATHSVVERRADADGETAFREVAFLPAGVTTYRDTHLKTNGQYRYRIQSENLGGWAASPSVAVNYTLTNGAPNLPAVARDDVITTVPDEARVFDPLRNDEGEGTLTLTAITPPTVGTAMFDAARITYIAPPDFSGTGATMTYTWIDSAGQSATGAVTFTLPLSVTEVDLGTWNFEDTPGTELQNAVSSSGISFGGTIPLAVTDGTNLVITSGPTSENQNRDTGLLPGSPYTAGRVRMTVKFVLVDFTLSEPDSNNANAGFALRDSVAGSNFGALRVREQNNALRLEIRTTGNNLLHQFDGTVLSNLLVETVLDLDAGVFQSRMIPDGGVSWTDLPEVAIDPSAAALDVVRFVSQQATSTWAVGDAMIVDFLEVSREEPAATLYDTWATAHPWRGILARGALDDPDDDGYANLFEFALGLTPTEPDDLSSLDLVHSGSGPMLRFIPLRDTDLVEYRTEFTGDLPAGWTGGLSPKVTSPAGVPVEESFPDGGTSFGRLWVAEP